jgi:hypothetical protein
MQDADLLLIISDRQFSECIWVCCPAASMHESGIPLFFLYVEFDDSKIPVILDQDLIASTTHWTRAHAVV